MKKNAVIAFLAGAAIVAVACGDPEPKETWLGTDNPGATATASETASATHPASPGGEAVVPDVATGATVAVVLEDGSIGAPEQSLAPGPTVITVTNGGKELHNLFVEGEGVQAAAGDPIPAGGSTTLPIELKAGTYTFYCPVLDHRTKGEEITVTVQR